MSLQVRGPGLPGRRTVAPTAHLKNRWPAGAAQASRRAYNRADGRAGGGGDRRRHRHRPGAAAALVARGDRVAILGRRPEVLEKTAKELGCAWRQADVTVHDAPLAEAERVWDGVVDANLKGPFLMSRAAIPHLRRPGGRIVNLSSVVAFTGRGGPDEAGYVNGEVHHVNGGWVPGR